MLWILVCGVGGKIYLAVSVAVCMGVALNGFIAGRDFLVFGSYLLWV